MHDQIITTEELDFLFGVLSRECRRQGFRLSSEQAEDLGSRLVALYQQGLREEATLIAGLGPAKEARQQPPLTTFDPCGR
jgi:hypothetical protein